MTEALHTTRSILDGLPDAAILLDGDQQMIAFNASFAALAGTRGQTADSAVSLALEPFHLLGTDPEADNARAKECFEKQTVIRLAEVNVRNETGSQFTMQVTFLPVRDKFECTAFVMVIFRDVTDEAELQARYRANR